jgi:nicotinate phosphoribosyltransferase
MAQLYYHQGIHEQPAQFDHFYRDNPHYGDHQAGYTINAGLEWLIDWMQDAHFGEAEIDAMRSLTGRDGEQTFSEDFLSWLNANGHFSALNIQAIPEGRVVHPNVPLTIVRGPLAMAQILETRLLNELNFQTLIATKAARIHQAGRGKLLLEFGARRAQEKAALAGARAALIGGCDFTSNAGVSHVLGFPPKGTHAHSMVQVFMAMGGTELDAFRAYADVYPDDCLLLVDTINTLESGLPNAIKVFEELQQKGHQPVGIRLDSGDLAHLAVRSAQMLDKAGFEDVSIVLSNQLDEMVLLQIITQIQEEAPRYDLDAGSVIDRLTYGVGTRLITSTGDGALDGVYKLVAVKKDSGEWSPAMKLSESIEKMLNPGDKRAWRIYDERNLATADLLSLPDEDPREWDEILLRHPTERNTCRTLTQDDISQIEPLHVDVWQDGSPVYEMPSIDDIREQRRHDLDKLDSGVRRIINPHIYHVSLTDALWQKKQALVDSMQAD